jgi:hypothetical protein
MPARSYAQLALASLTMAVGLFAFSSSFTVAILAFGLLTVGSVALCVAVAEADDIKLF